MGRQELRGEEGLECEEVCKAGQTRARARPQGPVLGDFFLEWQPHEIEEERPR